MENVVDNFALTYGHAIIVIPLIKNPEQSLPRRRRDFVNKKSK